MGLKIKLNGGYADNHQISLNDMSVLSKSIQTISKNFELKNEKTTYTDIYINATKEGSYEILLDLLNNPYVQGIGSAYLYDLSKDIKSFISNSDKKISIQKLIDEIYSMSIELADADYYDYRLEEKKQLLEKKEFFLNSEFSTFNAIRDISKLIKESKDEQSNRPDSISFINDNKSDNDFEFNIESRKTIHNMSYNSLELDDIAISGIPINITRGHKPFFKMKAPFFGTIKIYTEDNILDSISDYFKDKKQISVIIKPMVKMGELIETREGKLIKIVEEKS
ncbi:MAG: hypothetical protein KKD75_02810 [Nanoarchaeota archaeon]|nr:hypothetical protein [Nanoarchaeota archaeon]